MAVPVLNPSPEKSWLRFEQTVRQHVPGLFQPDRPILAARAPGRLDVMGGVADYSGSMVLEGTLAVATFAAAQATGDRQIVIRSLAAERAGWPMQVTIDIDTLLPGGVAATFERAHEKLTRPPETHWGAYAAGCLYVLLASGWLDPFEAIGCRILVDSDVPLGAGVSSSASLEVAVMYALCGLYRLQPDGLEMARLCQIVENRVVGAPCGIMDQVTCALGQQNALIRLLCRPHDVEGTVEIPAGCSLASIDSAVKHSVGGSHYRQARTGAFMGLAIAERLIGRSLGGYLCSMDPAEWSKIRHLVPERVTGRKFTAEYGPVPDPLSSALPDASYRVRSCAEHPILEHARVQRFAQILESAKSVHSEALIAEAGELMIESHRSYSDRIDLGSPETDLLVKLAMEIGPAGGIFGAKITGGGSGGTVTLLGRETSLLSQAIIIAESYAKETGNAPTILAGSSDGAIRSGVRSLQ